MKPKRLATIIAALLLIGGCAKVRDVEKYKDADRDLLLKEHFIGPDAGNPTPWIYKVTVVKTSANNGFVQVGFQSSAKIGHFKFEQKKLLLLNDDVLYKNGSDSFSKPAHNSWDIEHVDITLDKRDGKPLNTEVEDKDKTYAQKRYFKIDWSKSDIKEESEFPYHAIDSELESGNWEKSGSFLVRESLETSPNYISFVVRATYSYKGGYSARREIKEDYTYSVFYRYSFKRYEPSKTYKPYIYKSESDPLINRFGFFRRYIEKLDNRAQDNIRAIFAMERFDPEKEHHYYFAKDFPEEFKWIFNDKEKGIFPQTNKMFEKNGVKTRFHIHENRWGDGKEKEFGDIRYSFIKIIPEVDPETNLLGYGPHDVDPKTGEVIAGNVNLWTGGLKRTIEELKKFKEYEETIKPRSELFKKIGEVLGKENRDEWASSLDPDKGSGKLFYDLLPELTFAHPEYRSFTYALNSDPTNSTEDMKITLVKERLDSEAVRQYSEVKRFARKYWDEQIREAKNGQNNIIYPLEHALTEAKELFDAGRSEKDIIDSILYQTAIHEFGHNLGLRHNFYGTVDKRNFGTSKSASVMDYFMDHDELILSLNWEPYDEAALLYAYGGKDNPSKKYLFCTDEDVPLNPMCNRWDMGTSPTEIVKNFIDDFEESYWLLTIRGDKTYWYPFSYYNMAYRSMDTMKRFLPLWGSGFTPDFIREHAPTMDDTEFTTYTNSIQKEFQDAIKLSLAFLYSVITMDDKQRPLLNVANKDTGEYERVGTFHDRYMAVWFLLGNESLLFNTSKLPLRFFASYLNFSQMRPEINRIITPIYQKLMTTPSKNEEDRFFGLARVLYLISASHINNIDDTSLIDRLRINRYSATELETQFSSQRFRSMLDTHFLEIPEESLKLGNPGAFNAFDFSMVEALSAVDEDGYIEAAATRILGDYYLASKDKNPWSFEIIKILGRAKAAGEKTGNLEQDIIDLVWLYNAIRGTK